MRRLALAIIACILTSAANAAELDIRDPSGKIIIASDQIRSYDWSTHTLTLVPNVKSELTSNLTKSGRVGGIGRPFSVCLNGKPLYDGKFTAPVSSISLSTPVIELYPASVIDDRHKNELRIQLGYPTEKFFKGKDPRADKRIEEALRAAGKLTSPRDAHTEWVAASLKEMQTIKPGMTREDLLKVFTEEGGPSNRFQRRYAYHDCPYIKVDVKFDFHDPEANSVKEHPQDNITQISTPFLEWTIAD